MQIKTAIITPDQARNMLDRNTGNRPLRKNRIARLVDAIRKGDWKLTHQPIAITKDGELLDGQHRLHAIAQAGQPVKTCLALDCDPATYTVIDIGARRSIQDILGGDKTTVATVTSITRIHMLNSQPSPDDVQRYMEVFGSAAQMVTDAQRRRQATFTAGNLRAIVSIRIMLGQYDYVIPLYSALGRADFDSLPPIGRALLARALRRDFPPASSYEFIAFWWHCTNPENAQSTKPFIKFPDQHISAVRTAIESLMSAAEMEEVA